jgi:hypothetical protein
MENAQFNTMVCKESVNLTPGRKNGGKPLARVPATLPGFFGGGHRAKRVYCTTTLAAVNEIAAIFRFREHRGIFVTWQSPH